VANETPFETGMRLFFQAMIGGVHTAFPGMVQSYDPATMRAEIQPCLMRKYYNLPDATPLPTLLEVPVLFMSTGSIHIIAPPDVGSYVLIVCSERSLDSWLTSGGVVDPVNPRKFDLSDAVAIPGLFPLSNAAAVAPSVAAGVLEIRNSAGTCIFSMSQTEIGLQCGAAIPAVDYAVKYDQLKIAFDSLKGTVNSLTSALGGLLGHVHPGVTVGSGSTGASLTVVPASTADMSLAKVENVRLP
jgi:hypothetical protein